MIVIDASAILEVFSRSPAGLELEDLLIGRKIHAPYLVDIEVANGLRGLEMGGTLTAVQSAKLLATLCDLRIERHPHVPLLEEIWKYRHNLTAYDATYLALALWLTADLATVDAGLRKEARRHGVKVLP